MQTAKASQPNQNLKSYQPLFLSILFALLVGLGLYAANLYIVSRGKTASPEMRVISQETLREQYGLGVNLVAVTAAGGMVDVRLQIIDGEKAKAFLQDPANLPALSVGDDVVLRVDEEGVLQDIQFENGKSIFILFPNAQNAVKSGVPVSLQFGEVQVEPIPAK